VVARGFPGAKAMRDSAARTVALLADAGVQAQARPYVLPDDSPRRGWMGDVGPDAEARLRVAVVVRRRDLAKAEEVLGARPKAEPIGGEDLARLAEEAGPPSA
jgi:hypothetical protein